MPEVSVVMAVRNGAPYLPHSIESITGQTVRDFEFVIVDDGSTDQTLEILQRYAAADRRICVLQNPSQMGLAASLNRGFSMASGEFIARQDADDISFPERLGVQVSFLRSRPDVGLLGSRHYRMGTDGRLLDLMWLPETDTEIRWRLLFHNALCHSAVMLRRAHLPEKGPFYNEAVASSQDYELWSRLIRKTRSANCTTPLVAYRIHAGQVSAWHGRGPGQDRQGKHISHEQLSRLIPHRSISIEEVEQVRSWYAGSGRWPRKPSSSFLDLAVEVFHAFESQPSLDSRLVEKIRRTWLAPLISNSNRFLRIFPPSLHATLRGGWTDLGTRWVIRKTRHKGSEIKHYLVHRHAQLASPRPIFGYSEDLRPSSPRAGRALVTYVARSFTMTATEIRHASHPSVAQSVEIAKAFNRLGFAVDVIDWLDTQAVPSGAYDVFFGMHHNFERLQPCLPPACPKIYYATGAYWAFENEAERLRLAALKSRRGIELSLPVRLQSNDWVEKADALIVKGNAFTVSTYQGRNPRLYSIDNSALPVEPPDLEAKDFNSARRHFLWFSGVGLLHKGLDLALEVFAERRELHLWVCGMLQAENEQPFIKAFRRELFHSPNIHPMGWMEIHSHRFRELTERCAAVVFPSCSEGMPASVITCMARGVLPLVSRESGIDVDPFGIMFQENAVEQIRAAILRIAAAPPDELREKARIARQVSQARYSIEAFGRNMEVILNRILSEHAERRR